MAFVTDTFDYVSGSLKLEDHVGELGATWTRHTTASGAGSMDLDTNDRVRGTSGGTQQIYYASGVPPAADYDVEVDVFVFGAVTTSYGGPAGRIDTTAASFYGARWAPAPTSLWQLYKMVAGTLTVLGTSATNPGGATARRVILKLFGSSIKVTVDDTEVISVTDSDVTGAGRAGLWTLGQATSNGVLMDNLSAVDTSAPVNTFAPVVTGTPVVGFTLSCSTGTWTNTPSSYAYQWWRGDADIAGATSSTYELDAGDSGLTVSCQVTASNATGSSIPAASNGLLVGAALDASNIVFVKAGPDGLGGVPGAVFASGGDIFDSVHNPEAVAGDVEYRLVYLTNTHDVESIEDVVAWISAQTSSPTTDLAIAAATQAAGTDVTAVANEQTAPPTVVFTAPASSGAGIALGTIAPGESKGLWLRRTVAAGTAPVQADSSAIDWEGTPA